MFTVTEATTRKRSIVLDVLAISFGVGAWIAIDGIWVELPLLVQDLPEQWNLASYVALFVEIANIGPMAYGITRYFYPSINQSWVIYFVLTLGCSASVLLALFWDETSIIGGTEHSTALLSLVFVLALVDCTSSVLYVPYMTNWKQKYFQSYLIGEGLSGLIPALVALGQGVGGNAQCINVTYYNESDGSDNWTLEEADPDPNFSVDIFFYFLFVMMLVSASGFLMLEHLPLIQSERSSKEENKPIANIDAHINTSKRTLGRSSYWFLLVAQGWACFLKNGFLSSLQSYSCGAYGNVAYHLATTLSSLAGPLVAFATMFLSRGTPRRIAGMSVIGTVIAGYITATAVMSPSPPLMGTTGGSVSIVLIWILWAVVIGYVRLEINNMLRQVSSSHLFWSGVHTQLGSFFGALISFCLVNKTSIFQSYSPCYT